MGSIKIMRIWLWKVREQRSVEGLDVSVRQVVMEAQIQWDKAKALITQSQIILLRHRDNLIIQASYLKEE